MSCWLLSAGFGLDWSPVMLCASLSLGFHGIPSYVRHYSIWYRGLVYRWGGISTCLDGCAKIREQHLWWKVFCLTCSAGVLWLLNKHFQHKPIIFLNIVFENSLSLKKAVRTEIWVYLDSPALAREACPRWRPTGTCRQGNRAELGELQTHLWLFLRCSALQLLLSIN